MIKNKRKKGEKRKEKKKKHVEKISENQMKIHSDNIYLHAVLERNLRPSHQQIRYLFYDFIPAVGMQLMVGKNGHTEYAKSDHL